MSKNPQEMNKRLSAQYRVEDDLYCTPPQAVKQLLEIEQFSKQIWEPAAGFCHIVNTLKEAGKEVKATDIVSRNVDVEQLDFLSDANNVCWDHDIITNPPYTYSREFVEKGISLMRDGCKMALFLKLIFLEGQKRASLFEKYPPKTIYVSRKRISCWPAGREVTSSAVCYAWFIWEKGYQGSPMIKWFN